MLKLFIALSLTAFTFTASATCTQGSVEVSFNGTTSFDMVFNNVNADSIDGELQNASCAVDIPVVVPSGYFVMLISPSIAGSAIVDEGGGAGAVRLAVGEDETSKNIYVNDTYTLTIPASSAVSECGIDTTFTIGVDVVAAHAFINVFSGSGSLLFVACE